MSAAFSLSGEAMLCVSMCLALDPEPLFTLTARARVLFALSETCREARDLVRGLALPALCLRLPETRVGPVPSVETLVRKSDGELVRLEAALCTAPAVPRGPRSRGTRVDALLQLAANGEACWRLVPLKREMRQLGSRTLGVRQAILEFRLRPEDLSNLQAPFSREDLRTIALRRHGSERAMRAKDAELRARAKKRADTRSAREDRRLEMQVALDSFGDAFGDRDLVCRWHEGARDAIERYVLRGTPGARSDAVATFRQAIDDLNMRRALAASLPWPPDRLIPSRFASAKDAFVARGRPSDLEDAERLSTRWKGVLATIGAPGVPAEQLIERCRVVRAEVKRVLSDAEDASPPSASLRDLSEAYRRIAELAERIVGPDHPRAAMIRQQFPAAISPFLELEVAEVEVAAAQAARSAVERASAIFCKFLWATEIAPKLPSRLLNPNCQRLAAETILRAFADPTLRCDWADVAAGIIEVGVGGSAP